MNKAGALLLSTLAFPLLAATPPASADLVARVIAVHDGDTLTVLIDRRQVKVRLSDIDAPELGQPFGRNSKQSLSQLCFGKLAALDVRGRDRYRRSIAQVTCAGTNANLEQVRRGYAWTYARYAPRDSPLFAIEDEARAARRGLWTDSEPVAPWTWRRNGRLSENGGEKAVTLLAGQRRAAAQHCAPSA